MWEARLRPLHKCNGHTIFFRFLDPLALQRVGFDMNRAVSTRVRDFTVKSPKHFTFHFTCEIHCEIHISHSMG